MKLEEHTRKLEAALLTVITYFLSVGALSLYRGGLEISDPEIFFQALIDPVSAAPAFMFGLFVSLIYYYELWRKLDVREIRDNQ